MLSLNPGARGQSLDQDLEDVFSIRAVNDEVCPQIIGRCVQRSCQDEPPEDLKTDHSTLYARVGVLSSVMPQARALPPKQTKVPLNP